MNGTPWKPEPELKKLWLFIWTVSFVAGLIVIAAMAVFGAIPLVYLLTLLGWLVIFVPILIYIPAFYKTLEYSLDSDAIRLRKGVFWQRRTTIPYTKVTNIDITQGPVERMYRIGRIHVQTAGSGGSQAGRAEIVIIGIRDCEAWKDNIMNRIKMIPTTEVGVSTLHAEEKSTAEPLQTIINELTAIRRILESK